MTIDTALLLPYVPDLRLDELTLTDHLIVATLTATASTATCPCCSQSSSQVHSHFTRHLADRPWAGKPMQCILAVRRFFCATPDCSRRIFTERLGPAIRAYARRTTRLDGHLQQLAFTTGGNPGAPLALTLGMPISASTLIRLIRRIAPPAVAPPHVVGIDDWALRKGQTYGTILVDLERHQPIDLLPDREVETVAAWFRDHPSVEIISRDRATVYANGATQGAPQATQVADRWHLLHNFGEAVQRLMEHQTPARRAAAQAIQTAQQATGTTTSLADNPEASPTPASNPPSEPPLQPPCLVMAPQSERRERYDTIQTLHAKGWSYRQIAEHLQVDRRTVRRYIVGQELPSRGGTTTASSVTSYLGYISDRWASGCQNARQLWQEIQTQGYTGSYSSMRRALKVFRAGDGRRRTATAPAAPRPVSPRNAMWLVVRQPDKLTAVETVGRAALTAASPTIAAAEALAQTFRQLMRERDPNQLDLWMAEATASPVPELQRFAAGLRQDYAVVRAAVELPWSSGQVKGQVNRLKMLKRAMFGRAKFDLLRQRVLHRREASIHQN